MNESSAAGSQVSAAGGEGTLEQMLERIQQLTGKAAGGGAAAQSAEQSSEPATRGEYQPQAPTSLQEAGLNDSAVEELICKYLLARGEASGRAIADQIKLPFILVEPSLGRMKNEQIIVFSGQLRMNDYLCKLTEMGRERARRYSEMCTYFGAAPVTLEQYVESVRAQSIEHQHPTDDDLRRAFSDLLVSDGMLTRLGPALNSGRGMFLYGYPGNGKTSIAERVTQAFGKYIWIPRALMVDRDIIRVFDPIVHEPHSQQDVGGILADDRIDNRWIRVLRPTVVVGGELRMDHLEVWYNATTGISEAPVQLKSNCGTLVIDDFGRQQMTVTELLNRWIVPLEKRYDYLNTSNGKKFKVPFDQLVIFSTNLEPKDLVDDAFLRRIPYKIEVPNPSVDQFVQLFEIMCPKLGFEFDPQVIVYLIEKHYQPHRRPLRNCHPRDLLLQVRNWCRYNKRPLQLCPEAIDFAVDNYFGIM